MSSWRDAILNDFVPNVSKLSLVADPDCLLTEEKLALELRGRGFDLIEFIDPVEFRYAYESKYRSIWDRGEHTDLVVALRLENAELGSLPYDLLQAGRMLSFNLGDLFPNLSYPVIEKVDRSQLDAIFDAQRKSPPDRMGDNATKDFILRHVFGIAAELIANEVELLRVLLRLHYSSLQIPLMLAERLVNVLKEHERFKGWPLFEIVSDEQAFFSFLQERWPIFLCSVSGKNDVREDALGVGLMYSGPALLPFDHQDIKVYIDNLFSEGKLTPIEAPGFEVKAGSWLCSGISVSGSDDERARICRLFDLVGEEKLSIDARFSDWTAFAIKWAELSSLVHRSNKPEYQVQLRVIGDQLNNTFAEWLSNHYSTLVNMPPTLPAMVHHVTRRLARDIEDSPKCRVALIVVDGLALDQWVTIRQQIQLQDSGLVARESATFAWVPTLTSVSRQAIFSGKAPLYFPTSINSTSSEEKLWKQFWENHGVSKLEVGYRKGLGTGNAFEDIDTITSFKTRVLGLVVDTPDKIMHGMELGSSGMHSQIDFWIKSGYLNQLITELQTRNFDVWLTADHGNIQCEGKGRPSEGGIAKSRGERARVYPSQDLRERVAVDHSFAYRWEPVGLPENYFPLVTTAGDAFVKAGDSVVAHGGIAMEEVIVPLIRFDRKER